MVIKILRQWRKLRPALTVVALTTAVSLALLLSSCQVLSLPQAIATAPTADSAYQQKTPSRDGIGKSYMRRESAQENAVRIPCS